MDTIDQFFDRVYAVFNAVFGVGFSIPDEIFNVLDVLTNFVGYIMPLYLYSPIITLILSYWLVLIMKNVGKFIMWIAGKVSGTLLGWLKGFGVI